MFLAWLGTIDPDLPTPLAAVTLPAASLSPVAWAPSLNCSTISATL